MMGQTKRNDKIINQSQKIVKTTPKYFPKKILCYSQQGSLPENIKELTQERKFVSKRINPTTSGNIPTLTPSSMLSSALVLWRLNFPLRLVSRCLAASQYPRKRENIPGEKKITFALPKTQLHITPLQFPVLPINIAFAYSPLSFQYIPPSECFLNFVGADALNSVTANKVHLGIGETLITNKK